MKHKSYVFLRILHIEDEDLVAKLVARMLESVRAYADIVVLRTATLAEGIAALADQPFDAVLLDLGLPDSKGFDTFEKMYQCTDLPIVVLTAEEWLESRVRVIAGGAQDCIYKAEMTPDVLLRSLRFAVERARFTVELRAAAKELRDAKFALEEIVSRLNKH